MKSERKSRQLVNQLIQLRLVLYSLCFGLFAVYAPCIYCLSPINIIIVAIKQPPRASIFNFEIRVSATRETTFQLHVAARDGKLAKVESHIYIVVLNPMLQ